MNFIGQRSAIVPRVPRSRQLSDSWISPAIRLASVGTSPVPSLLSETIKNVGGHCCRILLREEGRKNYRDELLKRGRDLDRCRDRGYLCVRAVNSEQVPSDRIERIIGSIITRTWLRELRLILSRRTISRGTELKAEECACNAGLASDKYINSQQSAFQSPPDVFSCDNWDRFIFSAQAPLLVFRLEVPFTVLHLPTFPVSFHINDPIDPQGSTDYYQYIHIDVKRRI